MVDCTGTDVLGHGGFLIIAAGRKGQSRELGRNDSRKDERQSDPEHPVHGAINVLRVERFVTFVVVYRITCSPRKLGVVFVQLGFTMEKHMLTRRAALLSGVWVPGSLLLAADDLPESEPFSEGPAYKAGSPFRKALREPGMAGTPLVVSGMVLTTHGKPIEDAVLDLWQVDNAGNYDTEGYRLRGQFRVDGSGRFEVATIVPPPYSGRDAHIHVKIRSSRVATFTTEMQIRTERNIHSNPGLIMKLHDGSGGKVGHYNFFLREA